MRAKEAAREHVNGFAVGGGMFAAIPIPGTSIALTVAEAKMAADVASIYGVKPYGEVWTIVLKLIMLKIGGSLVLKGIAEGLNFIPVFGWLAKPLVAGTVVKGFGEAVIMYWEDKLPGQQAYQKPTLSAMMSAFGGSIAQHEMASYLDSYTSSRT